MERDGEKEAKKGKKKFGSDGRVHRFIDQTTTSPLPLVHVCEQSELLLSSFLGGAELCSSCRGRAARKERNKKNDSSQPPGLMRWVLELVVTLSLTFVFVSLVERGEERERKRKKREREEQFTHGSKFRELDEQRGRERETKKERKELNQNRLYLVLIMAHTHTWHTKNVTWWVAGSLATSSVIVLEMLSILSLSLSPSLSPSL